MGLVSAILRSSLNFMEALSALKQVESQYPPTIRAVEGFLRVSFHSFKTTPKSAFEPQKFHSAYFAQSAQQDLMGLIGFTVAHKDSPGLKIALVAHIVNKLLELHTSRLEQTLETRNCKRVYGRTWKKIGM